jgi:hypothetical protein
MSKCQCGHKNTEHGVTNRGPCEHVTDETMFVVCRCLKYRKRKVRAIRRIVALVDLAAGTGNAKP